jgi:hypothetical protein
MSLLATTRTQIGALILAFGFAGAMTAGASAADRTAVAVAAATDAQAKTPVRVSALTAEKSQFPQALHCTFDVTGQSAIANLPFLSSVGVAYPVCTVNKGFHDGINAAQTAAAAQLGESIQRASLTP